MAITTTNPATGEVLKSFSALSAPEIEAKLQLAQTTFQQYRHTSFAARAAWLYRVAEILEQRVMRYGELISLEMGKPHRQAIAEVKKCATVCRFYAREAHRLLADQMVETAAGRSFVRYQPLGVVLAVMPWNYPFWQVFRFAAPALMAGNVGILKHASNVPQCALIIAQIFQEAGFPVGAFQSLLISGEQVASILQDPRVKTATLTGSEGAGASFASTAGSALKKTVLELGGSDPFIVLPSANLEQAITTAVKARLQNCGQTCIAAKRFILAAEIYEEFLEKFQVACASLKLGNPMAEDTDLGPLATPLIRDTLHRQVQKTVVMGGKLLLGGTLPEGPGNFYAPTILTEVPPGSPADIEELFGPVAAIYQANSLDDAIALANKTEFGLGASAWTQDEAEQARLIAELDSGCVFINAMVKSEPRLPFGGIKRSGYGRELSAEGLREFVNIKTVWID
ncbi:MAG: NAD-dependent succinate-semialdehyde dehydrogenase [Cyanobacteria bacterium P01_H01_bin.15]